jgi:protein required for attachment to host cells
MWVVVADGERVRVMTPGSEEGRFRTVLRLGTVEGSHCPPPLRNQSVDDARNAAVTDLARRLDDEAKQGAYEHLVLVAPSTLLHDVREALGPEARSRIVGTVTAECALLDDNALSPLVARWWRMPAEAA